MEKSVHFVRLAEQYLKSPLSLGGVTHPSIGLLHANKVSYSSAIDPVDQRRVIALAFALKPSWS
jgi:hypothetical protein